MHLTDRTYQGIYSGRWEVGFQPYDGVDFSRLCYMFSGQGTAVPGMFLTAYQQLAVVRQRFDEADDLARAAALPPPSLYLTNSRAIPASALVITRNLATYTVQVGLYEHVLAHRPPPQLLTGSSQGEYAALVCAGMADFAALFAVHIARHRICGPARHLGVLLAVAASPAQIAAVLGADRVHLSILNSPVRSVLALAPDQLATAEDALRHAGIGTKVLEVPHPYHSPLMAPAAARLRDWLADAGVCFRPPQCAVLSSVTRSMLTTGMASAEVAHLLSRQLTEPVDFVQQIELAYACRCFAFLEIGPGGTLGTFVRKILGSREHQILDLSTDLPAAPAPARPQTKLNAWQSRVFGALRTAVATVTGYEIESISLEDRFQEDLAIDSLKKAEILVCVVEEIAPDRQGLDDVLAVQKLADAVEALCPGRDHESAMPEPPSAGHFERYAVVWQEAPLATAPARPYAACHLVPLRAVLDGELRLPEAVHGAALVLVAGPHDFASHPADPGGLPSDLERLITLLQSFQALTPWLEAHDLDIVLVTSDASHPCALGLASFLKALAQELPRLACKHLHCAAVPAVAELRAWVDAERADRQHMDIRYEAGRRHVAALVPLETVNGTAPVLADAVVVAFGGAKGITRALLERLAVGGQPHIYLAGRSAPVEVRDALEALARITPHVQYTVLDAQDPEAVRKLLAAVRHRHGRLDLVINAVGIEKSALLAKKSVAEMRQELTVKVLAASHILHAAQAADADLVVHFGSLASRWGNAGQTVYACAGEIVSQLTRAHNRLRGHLAAVAIEWPPWDGVGMTANPAVLHQLRRRGLALLEPDRAAALLAAELRHPQHAVVAYADQTDVRLLAAAMVDRRAERPVLGARTPAGAYQRLLDRTCDTWLWDHMIDGVSYLPAASAITMAFGFSPLAQGEPACLEDFHMVQAVAVRDAPVALALELEKISGGIGVRGQTSLVHFRCRVHDGALALRAPEGPAPMSGRPIEPEQLYRESRLFHGPTFQVLHHVWVTASGSLAGRIDSARLPAVYGIEHWDRLTQWLDGAFQLLGLASLLQEPMMAIPSAVHRIALAGRCSQPAFVTLALHEVQIGNDEVTGAVVLAAEGQRTLLSLEGVRLRRLRAVSERPGHQHVDHSVSQSDCHGEDARHPRRALRRTRHPGRRGRLDARRICRAGRLL